MNLLLVDRWGVFNGTPSIKPVFGMVRESLLIGVLAGSPSGDHKA
jgi:hypothetical protein